MVDMWFGVWRLGSAGYCLVVRVMRSALLIVGVVGCGFAGVFGLGLDL